MAKGTSRSTISAQASDTTTVRGRFCSPRKREIVVWSLVRSSVRNLVLSYRSCFSYWSQTAGKLSGCTEYSVLSICARPHFPTINWGKKGGQNAAEEGRLPWESRLIKTGANPQLARDYAWNRGFAFLISSLPLALFLFFNDLRSMDTCSQYGLWSIQSKHCLGLGRMTFTVGIRRVSLFVYWPLGCS